MINQWWLSQLATFASSTGFAGPTGPTGPPRAPNPWAHTAGPTRGPAGPGTRWTIASSACGCLCLTALSELTRNQLNLQPSSLQNVSFATAKHHATEGRTRPSACGCLTSLSADKKLQPSSLQNIAFETPCHGGTDQAFGLQLPLPNVAFWTDKKKLQIEAFKGPKHWLHHSETPCHGGTDQAFGLRLPLPNVTFWTDKKPAQFAAFKPPKR